MTPNKVLDDRVQEGMVLVGAGFDPDCSLQLERKGQEPLVPSAFTVDGPGQITALLAANLLFEFLSLVALNR